MSKHTITVNDVIDIALNPIKIEVAMSAGQGSKKSFTLVSFVNSDHLYFIIQDHGEEFVFQRHEIEQAVQMYNNAP